MFLKTFALNQINQCFSQKSPAKKLSDVLSKSLSCASNREPPYPMFTETPEKPLNLAHVVYVIQHLLQAVFSLFNSVSVFSMWCKLCMLTFSCLVLFLCYEIGTRGKLPDKVSYCMSIYHRRPYFTRAQTLTCTYTKLENLYGNTVNFFRPPRPVTSGNEYMLSHSMPSSGNPYSSKTWVNRFMIFENIFRKR